MLLPLAVNVSFSLYDALIFLLIVAGIVALVFLAKLFMSIGKTVDNLNKTLEDNKFSIDQTIKDLPKITNNVNNILDNTNELVEDVSPQITQVLTDVNNVTASVSNVTTNISDTVEVVGIAVADTASRFVGSASKSTNKFGFIKGLIKTLLKK